MNRARRLDLLADLATRCAVAAHTLDHDRRTVWDRIRDGYGRPTRPRDAADTPAVDDTGRSLHSDPTGEAATRGTPDTRATLRRCDDALERAWSALCELERIMEAHIARPATAKESREADMVNCDPGCSCCALGGHWAPVVARGLCDPCRKYEDRNGKLPSRDIVDARFRDGEAAADRLHQRQERAS